MPFSPVDYSDILEEQLTERDTQLQEKELPDINIGEAIPIGEGLDYGIERYEYGVTNVKGSVKDGIIGVKTNSLKTIDSGIEYKESGIAQWAKAAIWTQQEIEKAQRLNIALTTKKQDDLYANALATIQFGGYIGHPEVRNQEGLLNGTGINVYNETTGKSIADMTSQEFVKMILDAYDKVWSRSNYTIMPTHIAMDASDFMLAMQKFDADASIVGQDLLPIAAMDRVMAALRKSSQNDSFNVTFVKVPNKYSVGVSKGKTRLAIYSHDADYVEMMVRMPEMLPVRQRDLLTYECGYRSAFTGALWKEPNSCQYVDYKSS